MITPLSKRARLLFAGILTALLAPPVFAQQTGEQPSKAPEASQPMPTLQPQPTTVPGRPDIPNAEVAKQLRNVAPLPFGAAADKLPTAQLKVPNGFRVDVFASGIANARSLRLGDKGTVFVSNRVLDKVYAVVEKNGKRETKIIASGLDRPNGLAFYKGALYIAEGTKISKLENIEDNLENPPKPVVIYSDFLNHQSHGWKFMALGPDNKLYVNVGSPCNICEPPATNGHLRRIDLDGSNAEIAARGVRNSVGFDWHPVTKELYFTDNGRDWLSEDLPEDELNRVTQDRPTFRLPLLPPRKLYRSRIGLGSLMRRVRETGRPARAALGRARHALLHRQNVSEPIPERDFHRAPRVLESDQEDRRRCHRREAKQGRQRKIPGAVSHRLSAKQRIQRPAGRRAGDERRIAAGFRRSCRRRLSRDLRQRQGRQPLSETGHRTNHRPFLFIQMSVCQQMPALICVIATVLVLLPALLVSAAALEEKLAVCLACHGATGQAVIPRCHPSAGNRFFISPFSCSCSATNCASSNR